MTNSVSTREIRNNGGTAEICKPMREIGERQDCGYDRNEWRFDGGIEDAYRYEYENLDEVIW